MFWACTQCDCYSWWHNGGGKNAESKGSWPSSDNLTPKLQRQCDVRLNYEKLQYKANWSRDFWRNIHSKWLQASTKWVKSNCWNATTKLQETSSVLYRNWWTTYPSFLLTFLNLQNPSRKLSKEKVPFNWGPEHEESFKLVKRENANAPILAYYNPRKPTVLQTDASIKGLGACLLQDERPVYFASKALTEAQRGYVAIELESLAVAWAMEKFHHFPYANHFILETNPKPLETILSRSLNQATPHLQRILIRTFPYNFTVRYLPGLKNQLADCLSWVGGLQDSIKLPKLSVYQITSQLNARSDSLQQIREATQADDTLAILKYTIQQDVQAVSRRSQVKYSLSGPSMKN